MSNVRKIPGPAAASDVVARVMAFYADFSRESIHQIDEIYTQDVEFVDPVHRLTGSLALKTYMKNMAKNMLHYEMRYLETIATPDGAHLSWEMTVAHKRLNKAKPIVIRGMSLLKFTSRVYYHEDSYDLGALVYEHVPLLGSVIRFLKNRLQA